MPITRNAPPPVTCVPTPALLPLRTAPVTRQTGIRQRSLGRRCRLGRATELVFVLITGVTLALTGGAQAQTWDGGALSTDWDAAGNWNPDGVPAPGDTATISNAGVADQPRVNTSQTVAQTNISAGTLTVDATLTSPVTLSGSGNMTISVTTGAVIGDVRMGSTGTLANNGTIAGTLGITGGVTGNAGVVTGDASISGGTLTLDPGTGLADGAAVTVSGIGTLTVNAADTVGSLNLQGGTLDGAATLTTTTFDQSGGDMAGTVSASGARTLDGGTISGTLTGAGATTIRTGTTTVSGSITGDVTVTGTGTLRLSGATAIGGAITSGGGTVSYGNGITEDSAIALGLAGSRFEVLATDAATQTGIVSGANGLNKTGTGTLTLAGANSYTGTTTVSGGTLDMNGSGSIASTVVSTAAGATLTTNGGGLNGNAVVTNAGTLAVDTGGEFVDSVSGAGGITLSGGAVLQLDAGTSTISGVISGDGGLTITGTSATILSGVNTHTGGTTVTATGTLANTGTVVGVDNAGTFNNLSGATAGTVTNTGSGSNAGTLTTLNNSNGLFTNSNAVTDLGVTGGTVLNTATGMVTGTSAISGGTVLNQGSLAIVNISATGDLTNLGTGIVTGAATVSGGTLSNSGTLASTLDVSGGSVSNAAGGSVTGATTINGTGTLTNAGTLGNSVSNTGSGALTNTGTITGTVANTGTGAFTNSAGSTGAVTNAAAGSGNAGTIAALANTGSFTNSGTVTGAVANTGTFDNTGTAGAVTNAGTGTSTGTLASLTNSAGTFGTSGSVTGAITVSGGAVTNSGSVSGAMGLSGGSVSNAAGGSVTGATTINGTGTLTNAGTLGNSVSNTGSGALTNTGTITGTVANTGTGAFTNSAGSTGAVTNAAAGSGNAGTIAALANTAGTFGNTGTVTGAMDVSGGAVTNTAPGTVGGATTISGTGTLTNTGTLQGVNNAAFFENRGTAGAVTNSGSGFNGGTLLSLTNTDGTFQNTGAIDGALDVSGGTVYNDTITSFTGPIIGTVSGATTITGDAVVYNSGTLQAVTNASRGTGASLENGLINLFGGTTGAVTNTGFGTNFGTLASLTNTDTNPADGFGAIFDTYGTVSGAVENNDLLFALGTIGGTVTNTGDFVAGFSQFALDNGAPAALDPGLDPTLLTVLGGSFLNTGGGFLEVLGGTTLRVGTLTNQTGAFVLNNGTIAVGGTTLINAAGATFINNGVVTGPVVNFGTLIANNGSSFSGGTFDNRASGLFQVSGAVGVGGAAGNTGTVDMQNGSTADRLTFGGDLVANGLFRLDANLTDGAPGADLITVAGATSGTPSFAFTTTGSGVDQSILFFDANGGSFTLDPLRVSGLPTTGAIITSVSQAGPGQDLFLVTQANPAIGGVAANISLTQSLITAVVNRPASPLVDVARIEGAACRSGGFARVGGGEATVTGESGNGQSTLPASIDSRFGSLQAGWDYGCYDGSFNGWDLAFGGQVGLTSGSSSQDVFRTNPVNPAVLTTALAGVVETDFDQQSLGLYMAARRDNFTADAQLRYDDTSFDFSESAVGGPGTRIGLDGASASSQAVTLAARVNYFQRLNSPGLSVIPTAGFSYTSTDGDTIDFTSGTGQSLALNSYDTKIGFAGGTLARTVAGASGRDSTTTFLTANYYQDFGDDPTSVFHDGLGGSQTITASNIGGFGEIGVGLNYFADVEGRMGGVKRLGAAVRADVRSGDNVSDAYALTAQFRLTF